MKKVYLFLGITLFSMNMGAMQNLTEKKFFDTLNPGVNELDGSLAMAVVRQDMDGVAAALEKGADISVRTAASFKGQQYPLIFRGAWSFPSKGIQFELLAYLLEHGADILAVSHNGGSLLHACANTFFSGEEAMVELQKTMREHPLPQDVMEELRTGITSIPGLMPHLPPKAQGFLNGWAAERRAFLKHLVKGLILRKTTPLKEAYNRVKAILMLFVALKHQEIYLPKEVQYHILEIDDEFAWDVISAWGTKQEENSHFKELCVTIIPRKRTLSLMKAAVYETLRALWEMRNGDQKTASECNFGSAWDIDGFFDPEKLSDHVDKALQELLPSESR